MAESNARNPGYGKPVSIVMIAYNEADHIADAISEYSHEILSKLKKGSEFIIYLDKPRDGTDRIVGQFSKELSVRILKGEKHLGYALGMTEALKAAKNDIIFYSDSSGKHRAADFWKLVRYESQYDIISGWRWPRSDPLLRQVISLLQQLIVSCMFFIPIHDFNTGYKIIHREIVQKIVPQCRYMNQSFSSELLIRAYLAGYKIKSVPVVFHARTQKKAGTSLNQLPGIIWKSLKGFILLRIETLRKRPKSVLAKPRK
jgi:glycosyltransferase involved in cell wall biosynthesis